MIELGQVIKVEPDSPSVRFGAKVFEAKRSKVPTYLKLIHGTENEIVLAPKGYFGSGLWCFVKLDSPKQVVTRIAIVKILDSVIVGKII